MEEIKSQDPHLIHACNIGEEMGSLVSEYVPSWKGFSFKTETTTGWTNEVLIATSNEASVVPQKLILRKFGGTAFGFLDRVKENEIQDGLSKLRIGPQIYFHSEIYRIEEFLEGFVPDITWYDNEVYCNQVAVSLARIHRVPYSKFFSDGTTHTSRVLRDWVKRSKENLEHKERFSKKDLEHMEPAKQLLSQDEIAFINRLQAEMEKDPKNIVLSHTDTYYLNHIITSSGQVHLIDFEYVMPNPRMYDIANFFNESNMDYIDGQVIVRERIAVEKVKKAIKCYMVFSLIFEKESEESLSSVLIPKELVESQETIERFLSSNEPEWEKKLEKFLFEYEMCTLLANFNWANWGMMLSGGFGQMESFDYAQFASERIKYYFRLKKDLDFKAK